MLLLELASPLSLLALDTFPFRLRQHLFIFNPKLPTMDVHSIHSVNDDPCILGRLEVGKGKASKNTIVEVVVEGIGLGKLHLQHDGRQCLFAYGKRDVLDDDGGRDKLVTVGMRGSKIGRGGMRARVVYS